MIARVLDAGVTLPRWLLRASLVVMGATALALVTVIVIARVARHRRRRREEVLVTPMRGLIVELASGEDDGTAAARLGAVTGTQRVVVDESLVRMLAKVRGEPAQQIIGVLRAHGFDDGARRDLRSWRYSRRAHGCWTLGLMGRADAVPALIERLHDNSYSVALTAARALGMIGDTSVGRSLLSSLVSAGRRPSAMPAWAVIEALTRLGTGVTEAVIGGLVSPHAVVRTASAKAVALTPLFGCADALRVAIAEEASDTVLIEMIRALGIVGRDPDVPTLVALASSHSPVSIRRSAARALGDIGTAAARQQLVVMLADGEPQVAEDAVIGLLAAGPRGAEALRAARAGLTASSELSDSERLRWALTEAAS